MFNQEKVNPAQVAGLFYPGNKNELSQDLEELLQTPKTDPNIIPKAIIAPHAGYIYSGKTAAFAYKYLENLPENINNIIIFAPAHHLYFKGCAFHDAKYFTTPLGKILNNYELLNNAPNDLKLSKNNQAFNQEHSIETQLPFLQKTLGEKITITPILVGDTSANQIAKIISYLKNDNSIFVISSDMSHFMRETEQKIIDDRTITQIENYQYDNLTGEDACGFIGIQGILMDAKENNLTVKNIHKSNSGETTGDYDNVVGYASFIIY